MNNKFTSKILLAVVAVICGVSLVAQTSDKKEPAAQQKKQGGMRPRLSPHESIFARIPLDQGVSLVSITYGRPYSQKGGKGEVRKIWGGIVKWEKAERMGADEATLILLQHPIAIGTTTIPAGAHTLYIVASESGTSKLAFSSTIGKWGIPVDETHDIARVDLKKEALDEQVDQLTLELESTGPKAGLLKIKWEKTQFSLPFTVKA